MLESTAEVSHRQVAKPVSCPSFLFSARATAIMAEVITKGEEVAFTLVHTP